MPEIAGTQTARARSRLGNAYRSGDARGIENARRDFAAAKLEDYIARTVDEAPPLTVEQRARLALLLRGGDAA